MQWVSRSQILVSCVDCSWCRRIHLPSLHWLFEDISRLRSVCMGWWGGRMRGRFVQVYPWTGWLRCLKCWSPLVGLRSGGKCGLQRWSTCCWAWRWAVLRRQAWIDGTCRVQSCRRCYWWLLGWVWMCTGILRPGCMGTVVSYCCWSPHLVCVR